MNQKRDRNFFASIFSASRFDLKILNRVERINLAFVFISGMNLYFLVFVYDHIPWLLKNIHRKGPMKDSNLSFTGGPCNFVQFISP